MQTNYRHQRKIYEGFEQVWSGRYEGALMVKKVRGILQQKCQQVFKQIFFCDILVQFEECVSESNTINLHNM